VVHTSNNIEATLSKLQATKKLPVASAMLPSWATMSTQRSTLSKGRNFNAKLVRHCFRFWQQSRTLLRHCCQNGNNVEATFAIVAFDNVAGVDGPGLTRGKPGAAAH